MDIVLANIHVLFILGPLLFFSLLTRFTVSLNHQNWVRTFSGSATLILLPIVVYAITSVISGSIALSLGMIGALSIVRFRNPVRSSFELVISFLMISLGICATAGIKWLFILGCTSNGILILMFALNAISQKAFNKDIFIRSFSEGNAMATLEVFSLKPIAELLSHRLLASFHASENQYVYRLSSEENNILKEIAKDYIDAQGVEEVKFLSL